MKESVNQYLPGVLRQSKSQIREVFPRVPVDEQCRTWEDWQCIKDIQAPLM
jgi:hypothetical protein